MTLALASNTAYCSPAHRVMTGQPRPGSGLLPGPVAAILGGPGVKEPPHFPEWGVRYKAVNPSFDAMLMSLFRFIYWLWTETVVVDQVLL